MTIPNVPKSILRTKFRVPDEDYDSHSDESREESVQILDSHVRTYSVPSSDDDSFSDEEEGEISLSKSKRSNMAADCALTTTVIPESQNIGGTAFQPIHVWSEPTPQEELELVGPNNSKSSDQPDQSDHTGSSQLNPIDLEGLPPPGVITLSNDGEDESSERFSTEQKQSETANPISPLPSTPLNEKLLGDSTSVEREVAADELDGHDSTSHDSDSDSDEENIIEAEGFQSRSGSSDVRATESQRGKSIGNSTDDFDSVDEDDFDGDDFFPADHSTFSERSSANVPTHYALHPCYLKPHVASDLEGNSVAGHLRSDNIVNTPRWANGMSCSENMINVSQEGYTGTPRSVRRPPSPSDAALARKANATDHSKLDWPFPGVPQSHSPVHELPKYRELPQKSELIRGEASCIDFNPLNSARDCFIDNYDPEWQRYEERLANRVQRDNTAYLQHYPQRINPYIAEAFSRESMNVAPWPPSGYINERYADYRNPANAKDEILDGHIVTAPHILPKEPESHTSRLNIADIVNPHADLPGGLKRKADEISSDKDKEQKIGESQLSISETCEDILPDAQPRESSLNRETGLLEDSGYSTKNPDQNTKVPTYLDLVGPPKKKLKTASSTAINLGKFVSGVCVGVAGALAAFIAIIPMSVQEEALQELAKST